MSRTQAKKKKIILDTFKLQMEGIYSTSVGESTLDEAPDAYKPPKVIMEAIQPTAQILFRIKPIHNRKIPENLFVKKKDDNYCLNRIKFNLWR